MAKNFQQNGDVISIVSVGAVASGAPIMVGSLPGVALNAASGAGQTVDVALRGVYKLAKVGTDALSAGEPMFLDAGLITDDSDTGSNPAFGHAFEAAGNGVGVVAVRLLG